ncbi:MAG: sulfatase-like hydrolase/transferase, partial [Gemmatimonadaceae bacterium]
VYASQQSGDRAERFDATHRTLAEEFLSRGYATGGFVANQIYTGYETGLARGFVTYHDTQRSLAELLLNTTFTQSASLQKAMLRWQQDRWLTGTARALASFDLRPGGTWVLHQHKNAAAVIEPFLRWQSSLGDRPFFAFLNFFDAHDPHRTPPPYRTMFNGGRMRRDTYDGALRYLDDQIGDLLAELERRGVLRHTIVVITSDHGEHFGEHGVYFHGNSLYRELLRVPLLLLAGDTTRAGERIAAQVSLRDLPATILDLAHVAEDVALPGYSLAHGAPAPTLKSPVVAEVSRSIRGDPRHPTAKGDMVAVVNDSLHLIREGDGTLLAYAYRTDSTEEHNLAVGPALPALVALFSELYAAALRRDDKR